MGVRRRTMGSGNWHTRSSPLAHAIHLEPASERARRAPPPEGLEFSLQALVQRPWRFASYRSVFSEKAWHSDARTPPWEIEEKRTRRGRGHARTIRSTTRQRGAPRVSRSREREWV